MESAVARRLTVYKGSTKDYESIPRISLQVQWLEGLGFSIGDKLTIICRQGELIILKSAEGKPHHREVVSSKICRFCILTKVSDQHKIIVKEKRVLCRVQLL